MEKTVLETDKTGLGLVQVYTGNGKGKTTSAIGLAIRAVGHGYKVLMIQFMKGQIDYGEIIAAKKIDGFDIKQFGRPDFVDKANPDPEDIRLAQEGLAYASKMMQSDEYDIIILDEVNVAVEWNLVKPEEVVAAVKARRPGLEIIMTGRHAPPSFKDIADLISEIKEVKHPYQKGILARDGVEH